MAPADFTTQAAQALALWELIIVRRLDARSYSITMATSSRALNAGTDKIRDAHALGDPLSLLLVIANIFNSLADECLLPTQAEDARNQLSALLNAPTLVAAFEDYVQHCTRAVQHYQDKATTEQIAQFARNNAALLNLDAHLTFQRLTRLTAFSGEPGPAGAAPLLNRFVLAFPSVEELLTHGQRMPVGFSLCAILCPRLSDSYFVLLVKNGRRVTLLTDKARYEHPLQQVMMSGRNDRYNEERVTTSHFPYGLLHIRWADNGRRAVASDTTALVSADSELPSIGSLAELSLDELLWLQLLIDQCRPRYFENVVEEPMLALGSQLQFQHNWLPGPTPQLPALAEQQVVLDIKTGAELTTAFIRSMEPQWAGKRQPNEWMERRFGPQIPSEALYIPRRALTEQIYLLTQDGSTSKIVPPAAGVRLYGQHQEQRITLHGIGDDLLATREEVIRDAHFVARKNQANAIQILAKQDYLARRVVMVEWVYRKIKKNLPNILEALLTGDVRPFQLLQEKYQHLYDRLGMANLAFPTSVTSLNSNRKPTYEHVPTAKQYAPTKRDGPSLARTLGLVSLRWLSTSCVLDKMSDATVFVTVPMDHVIDILNVTGLAWEKLPEEIQYYGMPDDMSNTILSRVDPLQALQNPWNRLQLRFRLPVNLNNFKAYRKERGLKTPLAGRLNSL